jgi:hypothetical protein
MEINTGKIPILIEIFTMLYLDYWIGNLLDIFQIKV